MTVLFGHPSGNPNSHHAALAHYEAGWLEAFCVPWLPKSSTLTLLEGFSLAGRLSRRSFPPLENAPLIQGRRGEWRRLLLRAAGREDEKRSYEANDWLMRTMARAAGRRNVTAVHAYEDCALLSFQRAAKLGRARIYDMPIGCYPAWLELESELVQRYGDWLPPGGLSSSSFVRPSQKHGEMELADLVIVPSGFVANTVTRFYPGKKVAIAPYGGDAARWKLDRAPHDAAPVTFLFVGQVSVRKGVPLLLQAWQAARLKDARLVLVGTWQLADNVRLPENVSWHPPVSRDRLLEFYSQADVFVLPTFFEGRALVVPEAMLCELPVITTPASGADDLIDETTGREIPPGDHDAMIEALRWAAKNRDRLAQLGASARQRALLASWDGYRQCVRDAVASLAL